MKIKSILKKLPADFMQNAVRDVSLPTSTVIVDVHAKEIPEKFGTPFRALFMYQYKNQAGIFRSTSDLEKFSKKLASKLLKNKSFANQTIKHSIASARWMLNFIKNKPQSTDLVKNQKLFFSKYHKFFTYHQAIQWGGDYLAKMHVQTKNRRRQKQLSNSLQKTYQYSEMVVPSVEKQFKKLKLGHLLPEEINENLACNIKFKPKGRNVLLIKNRRLVLPPKQAKMLKEIIDEKIKTTFKNSRQVHGLSVSTGIFTGKARVITELNKLPIVKPNEILITTMTRPQYNSVLKKIGALVTDEGGMVSHAAILAREFYIPCVTQTKLATKIFKTGDLVEVNANHGWVRKIK